MVEAAVHYYRATGKTRLLQVATKLANHMADVMGPPPKKNVVPGHSLGEEALVKLYLLFREQPELKSQMPVPVDEQRYLKLAEFWIENRGNHEGRKSYGPYGQDHQPVLQQETIEGHAVRATLLCAGLVAAAQVNGREDYLTAARRLWENMVQRRMYVIGGLGAVAGHEGFGPDYVLPNNGYLETCAAIGAGFFHHNMNLALGDARYADELERVLYNAVLARRLAQGGHLLLREPARSGTRSARAGRGIGCPCCPPMFLKIMGALPGYIYAQEPGAVYVNLFVGSQATLTVNGTPGDASADHPISVGWRSEAHGRTGAGNRIRPQSCACPAGAPSRSCRLNGKTAGECLEKAPRLRPPPTQMAARRRCRTLACPCRCNASRRTRRSKPTSAAWRCSAVRWSIASRRWTTAVTCGTSSFLPTLPLAAQHRQSLLGGVTVITGPALAVHRLAWPDQLYLPSTDLPWRDEYAIHGHPLFCQCQPAARRNDGLDGGIPGARRASALAHAGHARQAVRVALLAKRHRVGAQRPNRAGSFGRHENPALHLVGPPRHQGMGAIRFRSDPRKSPPSRSIGGTNGASTPTAACRSPGGCSTRPAASGNLCRAPRPMASRWTGSTGSPLTPSKPRPFASKSSSSPIGPAASWNGGWNDQRASLYWTAKRNFDRPTAVNEITPSFSLLLALIASLAGVTAQEARIEVQADRVLHPVSRYLTGACIEDVNHEVYGGIDSQMIFGESFAEPPPQPPLGGFSVFGGQVDTGTGWQRSGVGQRRSEDRLRRPGLRRRRSQRGCVVDRDRRRQRRVHRESQRRRQGRRPVQRLRSVARTSGNPGARPAPAELGTHPPRAVRRAGEPVDHAHRAHDGQKLSKCWSTARA